MKNKQTVLIVDDIADNLNVIANILIQQDLNVIIAQSGREGINTAIRSMPDLILLDIMMPEMDGFEACRIIKSNNQISEIPVIFLTAKTEKQSLIKGFALGAVDFISKPFLEAELIARVKTHLELRDSKLKLERTQKKNKAILDNVADAIFIHDANGSLLEINKITETRLGYSRQEILLMNLKDISNSENFTSFTSDIELVKKKGSITFESLQKTKNGKLIPSEISVTLINFDGEEAFLSVARDITERKKNEDKIKKLSIAVEQSPASIVITDLNGNIEYVNPIFEKLTGYNSDEVIGQNARILKSQNANPIIFDELWKTISSGKTWEGEFTNKRKNGDEFIESALIAPIKNDEGIITSYIAIKEEITERKKAESKLIDAKRELEKKNKNIISSIEYAEVIQKAALPTEAYLTQFLPSNFVLNIPKDIVSGDFYWIKQIQNQIFIVAADCTGHGVPGAFMSMLGIAYLNEIVYNFEQDEELKANEILDLLRKQIKSSLHQDRRKETVSNGMDLALCIINIEDKTMQYAGANSPLFLLRKNTEKEKHDLYHYKPDSMPISVHIKEKPFQNNYIDLKSDDIIYLFSDGFIDQIGGEKNRKFLTKNFKQLLLDNCSKPMSEQKEILMDTFYKWIADKKQIDDVLIVGFKISESYGDIEYF